MKAIQYDLKGAKTAAEALDTAQLNWEAQPIELMSTTGIPVNDHRVILRSDNNANIGVVGTRYVPLQNSFAFSFFDTICDQHNARYDKAYVIDNGHKVILEATINSEIEIRKNDIVKRKIRLINTFDGTQPFTAQFVVWRLVCKNGLMGWRNENKCKVTHTKNGENKATQALMLLSTSIEYFTKFEEQCKRLSQKILDQKMVESFLKQCDLDGKSSRSVHLQEKVIELFENGKGNGKGTAWDIYNGFVEWIDHYRSSDEETRLANSVIGADFMKEQAFDIVSKL